MAAQVIAEDRLQVRPAGEVARSRWLGHVEGVEASSAPGRTFGLHDEGASAGAPIGGIAVHGEPALLPPLEHEGQGIEGGGGPQPDELRLAGRDRRLKHLPQALPNAGADPVRGHHQIGLSEVLQRHRRFKVKVDAELPATVAQEAEQTVPGDGHETVAPAADATSPQADLDVVPVHPLGDQTPVDDWIALGQRPHGDVREDDPEAEGVIATVALEDIDTAAASRCPASRGMAGVSLGAPPAARQEPGQAAAAVAPEGTRRRSRKRAPPPPPAPGRGASPGWGRGPARPPSTRGWEGAAG